MPFCDIQSFITGHGWQTPKTSLHLCTLAEDETAYIKAPEYGLRVYVTLNVAQVYTCDAEYNSDSDCDMVTDEVDYIMQQVHLFSQLQTECLLQALERSAIPWQLHAAHTYLLLHMWPDPAKISDTSTCAMHHPVHHIAHKHVYASSFACQQWHGDGYRSRKSTSGQPIPLHYKLQYSAASCHIM